MRVCAACKLLNYVKSNQIAETAIGVLTLILL